MNMGDCIIAKKMAFINYGTANKARIIIRPNQKWEYLYRTDEIIGISKGFVSIELTKDDFERMFGGD